MIVCSRAPLRLGLAGGGTDVSPYCDIYGGEVVNATISQYAYAELASSSGGTCVLRSLDQDSYLAFPPQESVAVPASLVLHHAVYREMMRRYNGGRTLALELSTYCDIPAGSGLGSSSTLVVAMIHAFSCYLDLALDEYAIAELAFYVERVICNFHGGRQDQFAASFGGFNFMEFSAGGRTNICPLPVPDEVKSQLEASLLLYYTGTSRQSAEIISDQSARIRAGAGEALEATLALKEEASRMKTCLLNGDLAGMADSMRKGWESKKKLAYAVSNTRIDAIYDAAIQAGAFAGKVSGAGGGGFMMFLVPPADRPAVLARLTEFGGMVSPCQFEKNGSTAWRVGAEQRYWQERGLLGRSAGQTLAQA